MKIPFISMQLLKTLFYILKGEVSIWKTLVFNFHYLPMLSAFKLPILIFNNVKLAALKGKVVLDSALVKTGMVYIGKKYYGFQKSTDTTIWEQRGGVVRFQNNVVFGQGSFVYIGKNGELNLEEGMRNGGNSKLICTDSITIRRDARIAWDVTIMDTDFHECININTGQRTTAHKPVVIGEHNWICFGCVILKGTVTPDFCIVGTKALLNKNYLKEGKYVMLSSTSSTEARIKGIYRDLNSHVL